MLPPELNPMCQREGFSAAFHLFSATGPLKLSLTLTENIKFNAKNKIYDSIFLSTGSPTCMSFLFLSTHACGAHGPLTRHCDPTLLSL